MGPEEALVPAGKFTERVPPSFDGRGNYATYCLDVALWVKLTSLDATRHGPALVGQLSGEAKHSANNIPIGDLCSDGGSSYLIAHLDKSFAIDASDKLDADLADFLSYTWDRRMTVEQYIVGFHARLDKISEVQLDEKVKGHMLLRQACLDPIDRSMIIGASSGHFELKAVCAALRAAYRERSESGPGSSSSHLSRPHSLPKHQHYPVERRGTSRPQDRSDGARDRQDIRRNTCPDEEPRRDNATTKSKSGRVDHCLNRPTFFSNYSTMSDDQHRRCIIDTGACASIVGKKTLDKHMSWKGINRLENSVPSMTNHKFGTNNVDHPVLFGVKVTFGVEDESALTFDIAFDVIEGELPFLVGLPSLAAMNASLNFSSKTLGLKLFGRYVKLLLERTQNHIFLPFKLSIAPTDRHSNQSNPLAKRVNLQPRLPPRSNRTLYTPGTSSLDKPPSFYHIDTRVHSPSRVGCSNYTDDSSVKAPQNPRLSKPELIKLHKQLRHPSVSGTIN